MDIHSLLHSKYRCKYRIVFASKYRRLAIYGKYKAGIVKILKTICERKEVTIIEEKLCPDCIHMLLEIPLVLLCLWENMKQNSLMIFDQFVNLKYKYGNQHFWSRGDFVDIVGKNTKIILFSIFYKT